MKVLVVVLLVFQFVFFGVEADYTTVIAEIFHGKTGCVSGQLIPEGLVEVRFFTLGGLEVMVTSFESPHVVELDAPNGELGYYVIHFVYGEEVQVEKIYLSC